MNPAAQSANAFASDEYIANLKSQIAAALTGIKEAQAERDHVIEAAHKERDALLRSAQAERDSILKSTQAERDSLLRSAQAERDKFLKSAQAERDELIKGFAEELRRARELRFSELQSSLETALSRAHRAESEYDRIVSLAREQRHAPLDAYADHQDGGRAAAPRPWDLLIALSERVIRSAVVEVQDEMRRPDKRLAVDSPACFSLIEAINSSVQGWLRNELPATKNPWAARQSRAAQTFMPSSPEDRPKDL